MPELNEVINWCFSDIYKLNCKSLHYELQNYHLHSRRHTERLLPGLYLCGQVYGNGLDRYFICLVITLKQRKTRAAEWRRAKYQYHQDLTLLESKRYHHLSSSWL